MTSGYCTAPQCGPSRMGLISGQYQQRFGMEENGDAGTDTKNRFRALDTLPDRMKAAGYATGMTGKSHIGGDSVADLTALGFDKVFQKNRSVDGNWNMDLEGNDVAPANETEKLGKSFYHLDLVADWSSAFIDRYKDEPFFLYTAFRAPHVPQDAPNRYLNRFPNVEPQQRKEALAMLAAVDDGVGQIMQTLRNHNLETNTLVFVISDNGAPIAPWYLNTDLISTKWDGSLNDPMAGEKGMLSEGGIRVPYVVYWKDTIPAGQVYTNPVITLDVAATANALAGNPDDPTELDGINLIPFLTGITNGSPHDSLFWRWRGQSAIRNEQWKYIQFGDRTYLFDIVNDPSETTNLADTYPATAQSMLSELDAWSQTLWEKGLDNRTSFPVDDRNFDLYVDRTADNPQISAIPDQTVGMGTSVLNIPFTVTDKQTASDALTYRAVAVNSALLPTTAFTFSGSGNNRNLKITLPNQQGTSRVTLAASDETYDSIVAFHVTINNDTPVPENGTDAVAHGSILNSAIWSGNTLPSATDTNVWESGAFELSINTTTAAFTGHTLKIENGGKFKVTTIPGPSLTMRNLTLDGGMIEYARNKTWTFDLNNNTFTLNGGSIRHSVSGFNRNILFTKCQLAGSGTIAITAHTDQGKVQFENSVDMLGFSGIFDIKDNGRLDLPPISTASFGLQLSGTGQLVNDDDLSLTSLTLDGDVIPDGIYTRADLMNLQAAYTNFFTLDNDKTLTVSSVDTYASWALDHNLNGTFLDDQDHDGLNNLKEFAFGGNPTNPADQGFLPEITIGPETMRLVHAQRKNPAGISYNVEVADELLNPEWTTNDVSLIGIGALNATFHSVTNQVPMGTNDTRFIRLRVEE